MKERIELIQLLRAIKPYGKAVEIGVLRGDLSKQILENWGGTLYMVDPWRKLGPEYSHNDQNETDYANAIANIAGNEDRAIMIRATSDVAANIFQDGSLDMIYIDANHEYNFVKQDIKLWYPKLKPGGIFSGHDYALMDWYNDPHFYPNGKDKAMYLNDVFIGKFGVNTAVDEFCAKNQYNLNVTGRGTEEWCGSWWIIKK